MSDVRHQFHCTLSGFERDGREFTTMLVGTPDEIAERVSSHIKERLRYGGGPLTLTPIHPANVWHLGEER